VRRALAVALLLHALAATPSLGQADSVLARAQAAYNDLDYSGAIQLAQRALAEPLSPNGRIVAYELLGFSYGALDSTRQAVEAFRRLIFLAPEREPDVERVSPRITSLYASALGQVLVVRRLQLDSASFLAGAGSVPIHFEVSRTAQTVTRLLAPATNLVVDSQTVMGAVRVDWRVSDAEGRPLPPGEYDLVVTAREGAREEFSSHPLRIRVDHARVDTLPHLDSLPGYREQPEMVSPPRDWRPLALSVVYTGLASGAFFALEDGSLGKGPRTAMISVASVSLIAGLALSLRRPDPRPSPTNVLYNRLVRELLARRNVEIARENAARHNQVVLVVRPVR
jgi:tetratricopeptide (TPR) repeat protein